MGRLRTLRAVMDAIYGPDDWNNGWNAMARELQNAQGWYHFDEADAGHGVVGFAAAAVSLAITVQRGWGIVYNASAAAGDSPWAWVYMDAAQVVNAAARHATLPRTDAVYLTWTSDPDAIASVGFYESLNDDVPTQRGCQATVGIASGTPGGSTGSVPAGGELLYHVLVPSTADGGALTVNDQRRPLPGPKTRPGDDPIRVRGRVDDSNLQLAQFVHRAKLGNAQAAWNSLLAWDPAKDLPYINRGKGGSGEIVGNLYPMLTPTDRTWWRSFPFYGTEHQYLAGSETDLIGRKNGGVMLFDRLTTGDADLSMTIALPIDVRGLQIVAAKVIYRASVAFDQVTQMTAAITGRGIGSDVAVASFDIEAEAVADGYGATDRSKLMSVTPVVLNEEVQLSAAVRVAFNNGANTNGELTIYGFALQFKEGRQ